LTGVGWGALHGIIIGSTRSAAAGHGLATGAVAWLTSYTVLPPARLYRPMWEYDAKTLGKDLLAHLTFGLGTGIAFRAIVALRRRGR
jgi:hypothetical protein